MQEHRIDGVQLTQQLQGIWVSAHHVSQVELPKILVYVKLFVYFLKKTLTLSLVRQI